MTIYIASSWKNQHGVEMLTLLLRQRGYEVISWIENNFGEEHNPVTKKLSFEEWVASPESEQAFKFDTEGAMLADLAIYYGPAGKDACAELGAAYGFGNATVIGLWSKGEDLGLMRKMACRWFDRVESMLSWIDAHASFIESWSYLTR
jgi:hypothetical protein